MSRPNVLITLVGLLVISDAARQEVDVKAEIAKEVIDDHVVVDEETGKACDGTVAEPADGSSLQSHFDGLRQSYGILGSSAHFVGEGPMADPAKCTKKDVCLLMRQLDMDFYKRARSGYLQDADYNIPPTRSWVAKDDCSGQESHRGFKMVPVMDQEECLKEVKKQGITKVTLKNNTKQPRGCVISKKNNFAEQAFLNVGNSHAQAGSSYKDTDHFTVQLLCVMDRSLSEASAAYYSPYKLKLSMRGREAMSTSCSFGMMGYLAQLHETKSPCAQILTYRENTEFHSAQAALDKATELESDGKTDAAKQVHAYVETIRERNVLMDTIANHWCPDVWTNAQTKANTCDVSRVMSWTTEGRKMTQANAITEHKKAPSGNKGGRMGHAQNGAKWQTVGNGALLDSISTILKNDDKKAENLVQDADEGSDIGGDKLALTEASCTAFDDVDLASILQGVSKTPTDFYRKADLNDDSS